ncbi:MalM family protein [Marinobacter sp. HL-58]|uniref:MalM family protein n=1 Tax=Marinobacter sp. HL-58 TaxID=1479237 RepID=UPI00048763D7|nr:MalM family protein [Marinobacter sp. HL-58]KPP98969.1 MAG: Maltose operon periplasmic protein precursor (MalM) [Marinobacter sp. HL-58]
MYRCHFLVVICLVATIAGCQSSGPDSSGARDGYFTWVDDQGQVRHTPIPKTSGDDDESSSDTAEDDASETADDEFNLENYPDGNQLEKDGYVRPGEPQPYFTWRDAEGNVRASYYQPDTRSAVEKGRVKPPVQLTEASIYQAGEATAETDLPEGADPQARAVLGMEPGAESFFTQWSRQCCRDMDRSEPEVWQQGREFGINLNRKSSVYSFSTGDSPYRLVRLPSADLHRDFILQLRSFAKDGVFVPSVAFLDESFEPLRIVTDLVAEYVPESWHSHGYLNAYIPVFPGRGERWMVIFTRDEDLAGQTVIEGKYGPEAIPHTRTGELGLSREEGH